MKKLEIYLLLFIVIGAFAVRLYHFNSPIIDWHSWRQADTSSVSRFFVNNGFDVLHPKFNDLSKGVSLLDNPQGHRFVEFPIYNVAQAGLYVLFGYFTLEQWGRVITIFSQLGSIVFLFLLVSRFTGRRAGIIASAFYAFIPFNVFYGRVVLPDSTTVTAILASVYFFALWMENISSKKLFFLSTLCMAAAFLLKPYALFFTLPHLYLAFQKFGFRAVYNPRLLAFAVLSLVPLLFWRIWMLQYPEGIPQGGWLFNGNNIRFKGSFFNWLFAERISKMILGYFGIAFVLLGIILKTKKEGLLYLSFLASSIIYLTVMASGNIQHDYYQILIIPTLAIFFAKGVDFILSETKHVFNPLASYLAIGVASVFMIAFSWFMIRDFYNLQHKEVYAAGIEIDRVLPEDAKVVAPYGGDTTFLYYINRSGWPVYDRPLNEFIEQGATHMAFVSPTGDELNFEKFFDTVAKEDSFVVFDLTSPTPEGELLLEELSLEQ